MTDKEKYDFIDHVVHLTIFVEDRLLDEHGGEYSGLEEDGIDSNEYYRIITERVIDILKKNNNYMQEEPVSKQKLSNSSNIGKDCKDEPVSEELEEAMQHNAPDNIGIDDLLYWRNGFITGAKWKAEQFEKNRLAACDRQTEEEAEIEREFVTSIIEKEHRQPTFDDAIKYGMRLQKEQFEKDYTDLCNGIATAKGLAVAMAYDKGMADAREQMINKFYDWLKSNATYIHPRKGTEECITTLGKLKQAMKDE